MYSHRDPTARKSGTANIFIKNLDKAIDNKALHETFSSFGTILSCKIATDASGQSKGYGFVQFEQEEAAQTAIDKLNGMLISDKQVYVGPFLRKQEREQANGGTKFSNVYVKNLSDSTTEEDLRKIFGDYGTITSAVLMRDAEGKSKCFGFINFENAEDAAKAVEDLNGKKFDNKEWYVGRAQKKSERVAGGMLPVPLDMSSVPLRAVDIGVSQTIPIGALASALANSTQEQQRMMLGENLYPLVDQLQHSHAAKITGMLLETGPLIEEDIIYQL